MVSIDFFTVPTARLRDRDRVYGEPFRHRVKGMGVEEVLTAPQSPWQNPFAERLIGSIRRECLEHVVVFDERHLRRILTAYFAYYHQARTHLALGKDAPATRPIELPGTGQIAQLPEVGAYTIATSVALPQARLAAIAQMAPSGSDAILAKDTPGMD